MKEGPAKFEIYKGAQVQHRGRDFIVTHVIGLAQVMARNLESGEMESLPIADLSPPAMKEAQKEAKAKSSDIDLADVSEQHWEEARRRLNLIKPLLSRQEWGSAMVQAIAKTNALGQATIYRWRDAYRNSGLLSSLLPKKRGGGRGRPRLKDPTVEKLIDDVINDYYLTDAHPSIAAAHEKVCEQCTGDLKPPHYQTVRNRILWRAGRAMTAARYGEKVARELHDANEGKIPDADWPLAMVMMDHTKLPIMIVHDVSRQPILRPWVTFSIDVFSRVVSGMYLSLDPPSAMSAGMCIAHAILPKEKWLADRGIDAEWPCWGVMGTLHLDNAKEFRGNMIKAACEEYTINLDLRPVKTPHYGGHIERLMGTVSEELKKAPGATFSNPVQKFEYDSEGNAIMTLGELEQWLTYFLAQYHHRLHAGIGTSPLQKYKEGLLGTKGRPGRGLPARRLDEEKVRIDFMPYEERTIQDYGVQWDLHYFADVLRPWVNARDPDNPRIARTFRFRRDPRDISALYFFDPNAQRYFQIPYRDLSHPPLSLWEYREAKRLARLDGKRHIDENVVFGYAQKMREVIATSKEKSKSARRRHQQSAEHAKARTQKKKDLPTVSTTPNPVAPPSAIAGYDPSAVTAYDDDD